MPTPTPQEAKGSALRLHADSPRHPGDVHRRPALCGRRCRQGLAHAPGLEGDDARGEPEDGWSRQAPTRWRRGVDRGERLGGARPHRRPQEQAHPGARRPSTHPARRNHLWRVQSAGGPARASALRSPAAGRRHQRAVPSAWERRGEPRRPEHHDSAHRPDGQRAAPVAGDHHGVCGGGDDDGLHGGRRGTPADRPYDHLLELGCGRRWQGDAWDGRLHAWALLARARTPNHLATAAHYGMGDTGRVRQHTDSRATGRPHHRARHAGGRAPDTIRDQQPTLAQHGRATHPLRPAEQRTLPAEHRG